MEWTQEERGVLEGTVMPLGKENKDLKEEIRDLERDCGGKDNMERDNMERTIGT